MSEPPYPSSQLNHPHRVSMTINGENRNTMKCELDGSSSMMMTNETITIWFCVQEPAVCRLLFRDYPSNLALLSACAFSEYSSSVIDAGFSISPSMMLPSWSQ